MAPRKKAQEPEEPPFLGLNGVVIAEAGGLTFRFDNVPAEAIEDLASELTEMLTRLHRKHPEIRARPEVVPGGEMPYYDHDDYGDRRRPVGFSRQKKTTPLLPSE